MRTLLAQSGGRGEGRVLPTAVAHGHRAMVKLLLGEPECSRGAVNVRGMTAVHLAVAARDVSMVRLLTQTSQEASQDKARTGHEQAAARLPPPALPGGVKTGTLKEELCRRNQLGWCALHTAAFRGEEVPAAARTLTTLPLTHTPFHPHLFIRLTLRPSTPTPH